MATNPEIIYGKIGKTVYMIDHPVTVHTLNMARGVLCLGQTIACGDHEHGRCGDLFTEIFQRVRGNRSPGVIITRVEAARVFESASQQACQAMSPITHPETNGDAPTTH